MITTPQRFIGLLLTIAATTALVGCSGGDAGDEGTTPAPAVLADREATEPAESSGPAEASERSDPGGSQTSGSDATGSRTARPDSPGAPRPAPRPAPRQDRAIIATGTVSLRSDDVGRVRRDVQRIVDAHRGQIAEENTETDDEGRAQYARLVLRVPSSQFDEAMAALEKAGELRASQRSAQDVTTQVIDTDVRVRAQSASLRRVEALLARADTLQQVIWIESQLTDRQAELDSLKSQQAWLTDQTALSTITVDIELVPATEAEPASDRAGFLTGLRGGLDALEAATTAIATVVGALLPFAVVLLVLALPARLLLRRTLRRRGAQPGAAR